MLGSGLALLCCAGAAPVLGLLSAIGLGLLINDAVLIPLLLLALGATGWGLWQGRRCHGRSAALLLGLGAAGLTIEGPYCLAAACLRGIRSGRCGEHVESPVVARLPGPGATAVRR